MKKKSNKNHKILAINTLTLVFFFIISEKTFAGQPTTAILNADSLQMVEYDEKGKTAYRSGDFEKAKEYFKKELELLNQIYGTDSYLLASALNNLAVQYKNTGEYNTAINYYLQAEKIYTSNFSNSYPRLGRIYINLGIIYKLKGDYLKCNEYQNHAIQVFSLERENYQQDINDAKYNLTESLFLLKRYDEAINNSLQNLKEVTGELESYYTSLLARIYTETGNHAEADKYYQQTFKLIGKYYGEDSYDLGLEYLNYVSFLLSSKKFNNALLYNQWAEKIIEKYYTKKSKYYSEVMRCYADYYFSRTSEASEIADFNRKKKEDLLTALNYYQKAAIANSETFANTDPTTNPEVDEAISDIQMLEVLTKKAKCYESLAELSTTQVNKQEAIKYYESSLNAITASSELIHQIRTGFQTEDSRIFLSENQESTYMDAVTICYNLYKQTSDINYAIKGYEFTEKSKSASFLAAVKDSKAQQFGGIPDSLINKENVLKINISNYKEMLFEENQQETPDSEKVGLYNSKIFQYNEQYSQLIKYLEENYPNYYSFKYKDEVADIASIRERLKGKDAIIEYLIQEPDDKNESGKLFRFVITDNDFDFSAKDIEQSFIENVETVYQFLTNPAYLYTGLEDFKAYSLSAYQLYSELLENTEEKLNGRKLIIIPDDKLSYIPFDALLSEMPDTTKMDFRLLPYLIKDHAISYTYSTTLLYKYFKKDKEASKNLLAFAPNYLNDERDYTDMSTFRAGLTPLPAVKKEVEYISKFVSGDIFEDDLAQENKFKELASDYDILHLAMHTILNDSLPMYSRLAFSKPIDGIDQDGWLNTSEIYTMQLKARMAVLSACNTGTGKLQKGEGVMSLARGFLYAGCPSIIMTLWEVEDESGALIMKDFYRFLSKGKSKDEALRLAKLAHIENADPLKAHPHYWLGYVAVGNPESLFPSKDIYFVVIIFAVIIFILADQSWRKKQRTKKKTS